MSAMMRRICLAWSLMLVALLLPGRAAYAATYTVTNTNDSGAGSLRWAINQANANAAPDTIEFNIAGPGVRTIQPLTALPALVDDGTTIDGYSQPGSAPASGATPATILIEIDGSLTTNANGLAILSSGNVVHGLVVNRFPLNGIALGAYGGYTATNNIIVGNYVGTNAAGTSARGNGLSGVFIGLGANQNVIGGTSAAERNLLSGNGWEGVGIHGSGTRFNFVFGNYIGTDASGTAALGNMYYGARIYGGAQDNVVGGYMAGTGNLISGNEMDGVRLAGVGTEDNLVAGNRIGTAAGGNDELGNGGCGVYITLGARGNTIGGNAALGRNIISGNHADGVLISGTNAMSNTVAGNYIGTTAGGTAALGNNSDGVEIAGGAAFNTVGGDTPEARNVISGNNFGVRLVGPGTTGNTVCGNYIGTTADGLGDLGNVYFGVFILAGAASNRIGGDSAGEGNVIAGNGGGGVTIDGADTTGNVVAGNYIGTDATGTAALGNDWGGVAIWGSPDNRIGGSTAGERNIISGNGDDGVLVTGETAVGNHILGNYIGTDVGGSMDLGNGDNGVSISGAHDNVIGGSAAGEGNIIAGNGRNSVAISSGASGNAVLGNYIGTDASGSAALGNTGDGVSIGSSADGNVVGGDAPGEGNLISGNGDEGIALDGAYNTAVWGNLIGTDAGGAAALGNGDFGIYLGGGGQGNTIGGESPGEGNVIAANDDDGIYVSDGATTGNVIAGNWIGTDAGGTVVLGNADNGIELDFGTHDNIVGPGNVIAHNGNAGVRADSSTVIANRITRNRIYANTGMGIDLAEGAHGGILPPGIADVTVAPGAVTIAGTSCPGCTVEVFQNGDTDGEGEHYIGSAVAGGEGNWTLVVGSLSAPYLTATATGAAEGTSEFSAVFTATESYTRYLPLVVRSHP